MAMRGMEILPGGRISSLVYRDKATNYIYKKQSHRPERDCTYFSCNVPSCTGTGCYKGNKFILNRPHNHEADLRKINSYHVLNRCKERAANENTPVKQIFKEEMAKYPEDTPLLDIRDVESTMVKHRRKDSNQEATCDIHEFVEYLRTSRYGKTGTNEKFFKDHLELPDGSINVILVSPGLVHLLVTTPVLYMDPSNKTVPNPPEFACCLIIYAADMGLLFPVAFVFIMNDTADSYTAVLKFLREMAPTCNPGTIITGYDSNIQTAVRRTFGDHHVEILGDFRHYAQMLKRKLSHPSIDLMNTIKSNEEPATTIIKAVFSLPLLPATRCIEGIQTVRHQTEILLQNRPEVYHKTKKFLDYIEDYWFNTVGIQSLFEKWKECELHLQVSTFNTMFLKFLLQSMKSSNSIWNYVDKLIRCEDREVQKFSKTIEGQKAYQQKCKCITKDRLTKTLVQKLERNEIYVWQFLTELVELSFVADDLEAWTESNDTTVDTAAPTTSYGDWQANNTTASRPEHIEIKPSIIFSDAHNLHNLIRPTFGYGEPSNQQKQPPKKKQKITSNGATSAPPESHDTSLPTHVLRQNEILASLLAQTNILYDKMIKSNAAQNNEINVNLQNDMTIHKSLIETINLRTQQLLSNQSEIQDREEPPLGSFHCRMCNERKLQILFRPCGHLCTCRLCWDSLKDHSPFCLICQERVVESIRVRY